MNRVQVFVRVSTPFVNRFMFCVCADRGSGQCVSAVLDIFMALFRGCLQQKAVGAARFLY